MKGPAKVLCKLPSPGLPPPGLPPPGLVATRKPKCLFLLLSLSCPTLSPSLPLPHPLLLASELSTGRCSGCCELMASARKQRTVTDLTTALESAEVGLPVPPASPCRCSALSRTQLWSKNRLHAYASSACSCDLQLFVLAACTHQPASTCLTALVC